METLPAEGGCVPIPLSHGEDAILSGDTYPTPLSPGDVLRVNHSRSLNQCSEGTLYTLRRLHILKRQEPKDVLFCMKQRRWGYHLLSYGRGYGGA